MNKYFHKIKQPFVFGYKVLKKDASHNLFTIYNGITSKIITVEETWLDRKRWSWSKGRAIIFDSNYSGCLEGWFVYKHKYHAITFRNFLLNLNTQSQYSFVIKKVQCKEIFATGEYGPDKWIFEIADKIKLLKEVK